MKLQKLTIKALQQSLIDLGDDLDFYLELFDVATGKRLDGCDTQARVSILRNQPKDKTQYVGFAACRVQVNESLVNFHRGQVKVSVVRSGYMNQEAQVLYKTVNIGDRNTLQEDLFYEPIDQAVLRFEKHESLKVIYLKVRNCTADRVQLQLVV